MRHILNTKEVMHLAMKIVRSVRARSLKASPFTWRRMMLSTQIFCFTRMLQYILNRGKVLIKFMELLPEMKDLLRFSNHVDYYTKLEKHQ